jgi:CHASE3 domain sensor protein
MKGIGKLLVLILGLAAVAFAAKYALEGGARANADSVNGASAPKRQLDNVRSKAKELEKEQQRQADDVAKKAAEQ